MMLNLCVAVGSIRPNGVKVEAQWRPKMMGLRRKQPVLRCSQVGPLHEALSLVAASLNGGRGVRDPAEGLRLSGLVEDKTSYKESLIVRGYEVGINLNATMPTIANLLREATGNHSLSMGFPKEGALASDTMIKLGLIWVTTRMHIQVYKFPAWGDAVEIETWCQKEGRIGTRRDWILKDLATSTIIGRATSKWVMMNQDTRKVQRLSDKVHEDYLVFSPKTLRLAFPEEKNGSLKKIPKLEGPAQYSRLGLTPRRADLDPNKHVNHVTNIGWALESIPQEIVDTHELQTITIDYMQECQHEDIVDSLAYLGLENEEETILLHNNTNGPTNGRQLDHDCCQFLHSIRLSRSGLEISRGCTKWRRLEQ